jgi:hypothetical protein
VQRDVNLDLDIPDTNREIALHLRDIRMDLANVSERLDTLETSVQARQTKFHDNVFSGLLLPVVGGMLLFLLTKALG